MDVILLEDVINLGYKGDIVKVKDGYGRNFLIPKKRAVIASVSAKKVLAENQKQQAHKLEAIKNAAIELGEKITAAGKLTIGAKTSSTGKIFGAVGPIQIAEALEKAGAVVDRKLIAVKSQVKEVGEYTASAKLHKEVNVEIPFEVVSE
jgi:large subunit ribosomal protein L9